MEEWQELLQKIQTQSDQQHQLSDGASQNTSSLLVQVRELVGETGTTGAAGADAPAAATGSICLPDGYVRRSPVQEYETPADYRRKTIRKWVLIALGVCLLALLVIALLRAGLLSFK